MDSQSTRMCQCRHYTSPLHKQSGSRECGVGCVTIARKRNTYKSGLCPGGDVGGATIGHDRQDAALVDVVPKIGVPVGYLDVDLGQRYAAAIALGFAGAIALAAVAFGKWFEFGNGLLNRLWRLFQGGGVVGTILSAPNDAICLKAEATNGLGASVAPRQKTEGRLAAAGQLSAEHGTVYDLSAARSSTRDLDDTLGLRPFACLATLSCDVDERHIEFLRRGEARCDNLSQSVNGYIDELTDDAIRKTATCASCAVDYKRMVRGVIGTMCELRSVCNEAEKSFLHQVNDEWEERAWSHLGLWRDKLCSAVNDTALMVIPIVIYYYGCEYMRRRPAANQSAALFSCMAAIDYGAWHYPETSAMHAQFKQLWEEIRRQALSSTQGERRNDIRRWVGMTAMFDCLVIARREHVGTTYERYVRGDIDEYDCYMARLQDGVAWPFGDEEGTCRFDTARLEYDLLSVVAHDVIDIYRDINKGEVMNTYRFVAPDKFEQTLVDLCILIWRSSEQCHAFRGDGDERGGVGVAIGLYNVAGCRARSIFKRCCSESHGISSDERCAWLSTLAAREDTLEYWTIYGWLTSNTEVRFQQTRWPKLTTILEQLYEDGDGWHPVGVLSNRLGMWYSMLRRVYRAYVRGDCVCWVDAECDKLYGMVAEDIEEANAGASVETILNMAALAMLIPTVMYSISMHGKFVVKRQGVV